LENFNVTPIDLLEHALSNVALATSQLTDEQLVAAILKGRSDDPLIEELVLRFGDYSAELVSLNTAPQPVT
jgi:hypothetical protein